MDTWEKMYEEARTLYNPHEVSDFVYANHVVAAVEAEDGQIFTGFCMEGTCGVFHLCAERAALFNICLLYTSLPRQLIFMTTSKVCLTSMILLLMMSKISSRLGRNN